MNNPELKKILTDYGYDPNWPIDEGNILSLMQKAYEQGRTDIIKKNMKKFERDINMPILKAAIKFNYPNFDQQDIDSYYAEYFAWNCVAQVALKLLRENLTITEKG